jgi:hypothetical protein
MLHGMKWEQSRKYRQTVKAECMFRCKVLIAIVNLQYGLGDVESATQATPVKAKHSGPIERKVGLLMMSAALVPFRKKVYVNSISSEIEFGRFYYNACSVVVISNG